MKPVHTLLTTLALGAPLVLGAGIASAQSHIASPRAEAAARSELQLRRMNRLMPAQLVRKVGVVESFVYAGNRVRGLVLTDGTVLSLRPTNRSLFRTVRPGAVIRYRGFVRPTGDRRVVRDASIAAVRRDLRNASYTRPYVRPAPYVAPAPLAAEGTITAIVRGADGRARFVVLSNGLTVSLPPTLARRFGARGLRVGERVTVSTHLMGANPGTPLVVRTLTFSDGTTIQQ